MKNTVQILSVCAECIPVRCGLSFLMDGCDGGQRFDGDRTTQPPPTAISNSDERMYVLCLSFIRHHNAAQCLA
jgi:hypothetical protein